MVLKKICIRIIKCIKDEWILSLISHFTNEEPETECCLIKIGFGV